MAIFVNKTVDVFCGMRKSDAWEAVRSAVLATAWLLVRARNNYICVC